MPNLLGVSFAFGAKDVSFAKSAKSATKDLDNINDLLDHQDKEGKKLTKTWGGMGKAMSKMRARVNDFNLATIASNMREMSGETGNLSNEIESMGVSFAQASKPIIASMNLTGKEAKKMVGRVGGMALSLNVGAEQVAETFKAIHNAGGPAKKAIDAMGMSQKDWVKTTQTTGITMQDYSAMMGDMVASWGASGKQASSMVNNIVAIGKAANVGTSALKGAKGQLDALDVIFESLPPSMARSADEVQSLMESTYKLSGAFIELGSTEEEAVSLGQDTAKMFAEQSVKIQKAMEIGGDVSLDDNPLFKFMVQLGIGTDEAISIIDEGSRDAVKGVSRINEVFAKFGGKDSKQVQYALAGLTESLGSSAAGLGWLASNTDVGTKSLAKMNNMVVNGKDALKKYANQAFSSGRTLQDSFNLAQQVFDTKIRSISRKGVKGWAKDMMKAYKSVGNELKELGDDKTWGPVMHAIADFKQMGVGGMFMNIGKKMGMNREEASKMAVKFNFVFDTIKEVGGALGPLMETFGMFGPLGAAAGGIVGFFMLDQKQRDAIWATIEPMWDKFKKAWDEDILPAAKEAWASIGKYWDEEVSPVINKFWEEDVSPAIKKSWNEDIFPAIKGAWKSFFGWLGENIPKWWEEDIKPAILLGIHEFTREGGIGSQLWDALTDLFGSIWDEFGIGGVAAAGAFGLAFMGQIPMLGGALNTLGGSLVNVAGSMVSTIFQALGPSGTLVLAAGAAGVAIGTMISNHLEGEADEQWSKISTLQDTNVGEVLAKTGSTKEKLDRLKWLNKEKELLETSSLTTTDVGDFFTRTLLGEKTQKELALENASKQAKILEKSVAYDLGEGGIKRKEKPVKPAQKPAQKPAGAKGASWPGAGGYASYGGMGVFTEESKKVMDEAANVSGVSVFTSFAEGVEESAPVAKKNVSTALEHVKNMISSPATEGPLAGNADNNPLFKGGYDMMQTFAEGLYSGSSLVGDAIKAVLDDSIILTMETYRDKMKELGQKQNKDLMRSIAKQMVRDFGGGIQLGSVEVDGATLDAKQTFEAALEIPGLGGVIAAIASDGHKTRVVLKKIYDETKAISTSELVSKTRVGKGGAFTVLPG